MRRDRHGGLRAAAEAVVVVALGLALGGGALAQSETGDPLSPEQVRACLCLEELIDDLRREIDLQEVLSRERRAELQAIDREIQQRRAAMNAGDPAAIDEMRRLVARQQMLRDLLRSSLRGTLGDTVERLNDRVGTYNRLCAGRPVGVDINRAKQDLECPGS